MHVTIILPYGIFEELNTQYKNYIDEAVTKTLQNKPDILLLCGGIKKDGLTEAQSLQNYIQNKFIGTKILKEEKSYTTAGNLEYAKEELEKENIPLNALTIYCDSIRAPKIFLATLELWAQELSEEQRYLELFNTLEPYHGEITKNVTLRYKNLTIEGIDLHRTYEELGYQIGASLIESMFLKYPKIHQTFVNYRKKKWNLE
jgi:hypothetical protein